jgi:hypothetical protein
MSTLDVGRARLAITGGLLALLAATNRWQGWTAGWQLVDGHDEPIYKQMALAAPHLPTLVPNQHAQEFPLVYLVGLAAHLLGVSVDYVFRAVAYGVIVAICLSLHRLLDRAGVRLSTYAVCMALLILNTYCLRYYLIVPGYFLDVTFVLAIGIALGALISERYWLVVAAIVLGVLARQTAVVTSLTLGWWVAFGPGWRDAGGLRRACRAIGAVAIPVVTYLALVRLSARFSAPDTPGIVGLTVIGDLEHLPSTLGALADHAVRVADGLFAVAGLTGVAILSRYRTGDRARLPFEFVGCSVVGWSIVLQALALNTSYSGHPERLTVLAMLPFVAAIGYLLREREQVGLVLPGSVAAVMIAVLTVGSLQYLYTVVGPSTAAQGAILQLVAAAVVSALLWRQFRANGLARTAGPGPAGSPGRA